MGWTIPSNSGEQSGVGAVVEVELLSVEVGATDDPEILEAAERRGVKRANPTTTICAEIMVKESDLTK